MGAGGLGEAAPERPTPGVIRPGQWRPYPLVGGQQFTLAAAQRGGTGVVLGQARQLDLDPNEVGAVRFAVVLVPVGVNQPQRIVVRLVENALLEIARGCHR